MKRINKILVLIFLLAGICASQELYPQEFPAKPVPPRLVNDFAGMLNQSEISRLEDKLVAYDDTTGTQIAIVTVEDLHGYAASDYAQRLAEEWGIGTKGLDNGVLILVKPKTDASYGEVFIAQGYGLEGVIPDLVCSQIVDNELLPSFREGRVYEGLDMATDVLMSLASREFSADEYAGKRKKEDDDGLVFGIVFFLLIIFAIIASGRSGRNGRNISTKGLPLWLLLSMMNSGRGSGRGSWGGFSGGGGGGGFGGFGGGSFGGGGAGGRW